MRLHSGKAMAAVASVVLSLTACMKETPNEAANLTRDATKDAYVYGYPLVLMDVSRAKLTNVPHPMGTGLAPINQFANIQTFPDATFTDVVSPNADTLYSSAWLDLRALALFRDSRLM